MPSFDQEKKTAKKNNRRLIIWLVCGVLFMFGFSYMLVPLYRLVCQQEGINGGSVRAATEVDAGMQVDRSRVIKVTFSTQLHNGIAFRFMPLQHSILIHPGERKLVYFYAENQTGRGITVQAIPSITPVDAARYLKKTECFCFTQQYFYNHEKADMPVYFFIEPSIAKDIKEVTLSYTLFDASGYLKKDQAHFTHGRIEI